MNNCINFYKLKQFHRFFKRIFEEEIKKLANNRKWTIAVSMSRLYFYEFLFASDGNSIVSFLIQSSVIDRTSTLVESCHSGRLSRCPLICKRRHNFRQPDTIRWSGRSGNRILWVAKGSVKIKKWANKSSLYWIDTKMYSNHLTFGEKLVFIIDIVFITKIVVKI